MLWITIPPAIKEDFDDETNEFIYTVASKEQTLKLEHSLVSLSKWESKWCKPFLSTNDKSREEVLDYIKCMTLTQNVDPDVYERLTNENIRQIEEYIDAPMTATTISNEENGKKNHEIVTAEIIYYWMIALQIPVEFEKWHLNRLIMLIRVCNEKNRPRKKLSKKEAANRNAALNAARRKKFNTRG